MTPPYVVSFNLIGNTESLRMLCGSKRPSSGKPVPCDQFLESESRFCLLSFQNKIRQQRLKNSNRIVRSYIPLMPSPALSVVVINRTPERLSKKVNTFRVNLNEGDAHNQRKVFRAVSSRLKVSGNRDTAIAINRPSKIGHSLCFSHTSNIRYSNVTRKKTLQSAKPGQQGRISDSIWNLKQFPA